MKSLSLGRNRTKGRIDSGEKPTKQLVILGSSKAGKSSLFEYLTKSEALKTAEKVKNSKRKKNKSAPTLNNSYTSEGASKLKSLYLRDGGRRRIFRKLLFGTHYLAKKIQDEIDIASEIEIIEKDIRRFNSSKQYELTPEAAECLKSLWEIEEIRKVFQKCQFDKDFANYEHLNFYQDKLVNYPSYGGKDWYPDIDDLIRCSSELQQKKSKKIHLRNYNVNITDGSGQDPEKVLQQITNSNWDSICVVYVVPLGDYDESIMGDDDKNALHESYTAYKHFQTKIFPKYRKDISSVIVYFNKIQKFIYKFKTYPSLDLTGLPIYNYNLSWKEAAMRVMNCFYDASAYEYKSFFCVGSVFHSNSIDILCDYIANCLSIK